MPSKENPFKIEHWKPDQSEKIEDLASAATHKIIRAAWNEAVRTTPGALLILTNGGRVTERMVTPGKTPSPTAAPLGSAKLGDLRSFHILRAFCPACLNSKHIEPQQLIDRYGAKTELAKIEEKLRCSKCDSDAVRLEVHTRPR